MSLADLVRELIALGLGKKTKPEEEDITVLERIDAMNAYLWEANKVLLEFLSRGIKAAAGSRYFAALSADLTNQLTQAHINERCWKDGPGSRGFCESANGAVG